MSTIMIISFLLVQALAIFIIARFFIKLKGPKPEEFRKWVKENPEQVAKIRNEDQYGM